MYLELQLRTSVFCQILASHVLDVVATVLPPTIDSTVTPLLALNGDGIAFRQPFHSVTLLTSSGPASAQVSTIEFEIKLGPQAINLSLSLAVATTGDVTLSAHVDNLTDIQQIVSGLTQGKVTLAGLNPEVSVPLPVNAVLSRLQLPTDTKVVNAGISISPDGGVTAMRLEFDAPDSLTEWTDFFNTGPQSWIDLEHMTNGKLDRQWAVVLPSALVLPILTTYATQLVTTQLEKKQGSIVGAVACGWNVPANGRFPGGPDEDWPLEPNRDDVAVFCNAKIHDESAGDVDAKLFVGLTLMSGLPGTIGYQFYGSAHVSLGFFINVLRAVGGPIAFALGTDPTIDGDQGSFPFPDIPFDGCRLQVDVVQPTDTALVLGGDAVVYAITRLPVLATNTVDFAFAFGDVCRADTLYQAATVALTDGGGSQFAPQLVATVVSVTGGGPELEVSPAIGSSFDCPALINFSLPISQAPIGRTITVQFTSNGGSTEIVIHSLGRPTADVLAELESEAAGVCSQTRQRKLPGQSGAYYPSNSGPRPSTVQYREILIPNVWNPSGAPWSDGMPAIAGATQTVTSTHAVRQATSTVEGGVIKVTTVGVPTPRPLLFNDNERDLAVLRRLLAAARRRSM